jgi:nitroimidazol reductase NimA-like FMN-containing flavoprotein (pyridoxamine 5'-phosphate oxidase superfamily)
MRLDGPWSAEAVASYLESAVIPLRLGAVRADGAPIVLSLWFVPIDGELCCATRRAAYIVDLLRADPRCAFEIAADLPPYKGVRGQARATLDDDRGAQVLERLLHRYAVAPSSRLGHTLLARAHDETAIRLVPQSILSWDFTARMTD